METTFSPMNKLMGDGDNYYNKCLYKLTSTSSKNEREKGKSWPKLFFLGMFCSHVLFICPNFVSL